MTPAELAEKLEKVTAEKLDTVWGGMRLLDELRQAAARLRSMEEALKPFAEVARLEELHGSTLGHRDIPDKQISAVDFQNERGHLLSIRGPEMGDFRKARAALSGEGQ